MSGTSPVSFTLPLHRLTPPTLPRINSQDAQHRVRAGHSLDLQGPRGETLLHIAASHGLDDVVEYLLNHGAAVTLADEDGYTPLHIAVLFGHVRHTAAFEKWRKDTARQA